MTDRSAEHVHETPGYKSATTELQKECVAYTQYLIHQLPEPYIIRKYEEAHLVREGLQPQTASRFDRFLLKIPKHRWVLKLADVFTLYFHDTSMLRRKFFLLIAILETRSSTSSHFDFPDRRTRAGVLAKILWDSAGFLIFLVAAILILGPVYLILKSSK